MPYHQYQHLVGDTGYLLIKVPQDILYELKISVDKIQNDFTKATPHNSYLEGQIDKEYLTTLTNKPTQYIKQIVEQYCNSNPSYIGKISNQFRTTTPHLKYEGEAWVNFQEKYEYNPIHKHDGIFSYVIWYQIPFYKEDEAKYGAGKNKNPEDNTNGQFQFLYYNGESVVGTPLSIDKTMEGHMVLFPSSLHHVVYPFYTSNDYRITISGNVLLSQG